MRQPRIAGLLAGVLFLCGALHSTAAEVIEVAVEADVEEAAVVMQPQFQLQENQFDLWVFNNQQNVANARKHLETTLKMYTADVDRSCQLTPPQRQKLMLAGRGDIYSFFERVDEARARFKASNRNQQNINELWQLAQPLQAAYRAGLFTKDSLFMKTLKRTLTPEQDARHAKVARERRLFQYRARIELTIASMEGTLPLRQEQRQKFIELLAAETRPPLSFGQNDTLFVMWSASQIPEEKLKPLFSDEEWKRMSQILNQSRGMGEWIKQNGMLEDAAGGAAPPEAGAAPAAF